MDADELRRGFLDFFARNEHIEKPSSSLVPAHDPSLMFTNSGMVQFKNIFTGLEKSDCKRATTAQRCLRAGGKHNDLENVGYTKRHHTLFEMLGNFSFGDYFKEQAIVYAWDFLTKELKLDKEKLLVTVYHEDDDAWNLWKKIAGLHDDMIIRIPTSDNFWQMGDSGPCGPCSEIFYDNGEHEVGEVVKGVEIWNLVFMQYDLQNGKKTPLPKPCVDTGMGLERMLAVLEDKRDNFDTSQFAPIVEIICENLGLQTKQAFAAGSEQRSSIKVIADHARACSVMLKDNIVLSNEGSGYVLRRILRRAMRHIKSIDEREPIFKATPIFYEIVHDAIPLLGDAFSDLNQERRKIERSIENEEERFLGNLDTGLRVLKKIISDNPTKKILKGEDAFTLYDTYGFPLDLTADTLRERSISVDYDGFDKAMARQKARGRAAWVDSGASAHASVWYDIAQRENPTHFLGYEPKHISDAQILAIVKIKEGQSKEYERVDFLEQGEQGVLIVDKTPFYPEGGGQRGDVGSITSENGAIFEVSNTHSFKTGEDKESKKGKSKKINGKNAGLILHHGKLTEGKLSYGGSVALEIKEEHRKHLSIHHTATHLLHAALRQTLGEQARQRGSQITEQYLRFDFNHDSALTTEELAAINNFVNIYCQSVLSIKAQEMPRAEADKIGAMALFGEKYGEQVRVVTINNVDKNLSLVSVELCGGTHVNNTAEIGTFKITSEHSVGAGLRRIEARAGPALTNYLEKQSIDSNLQIESLREDNEKLQAQLKQKNAELLLLRSASKGASSGSNLVRDLGELEPKQLKPLATQILKSEKLPAIALVSRYEGKASLLLALAPETAKTLSAVELIKPAQEILQGRGGGKATLAQTGSSQTDKIPQAIKALEETLANNIKPAIKPA